ncbi:MAG: mechanosensitive ion channel family protein [Acidobacteria bacterium]|nr:mechanosensitive ion channel family protein [Acidobacteriota bacterium]MCB9397508.1 mechanosensitive ion channel family protein [Acidobacteriota bacterium]
MAHFLEDRRLLALYSLLAALILSWLVSKLLFLILKRWAGKTKTDLDDRLLNSLRVPVSLTIILLGGMYAMYLLNLGDSLEKVTLRAIQSLIILVWMFWTISFSGTLIQYLGRAEDPQSFFKPRIQPLLSMLTKTLVTGVGLYFLFKTWDSDVSGWLASAGIVGLAVGFAAKDTLANLFSGVFILADSPYKLGDYVVLDEQTRGRVTHIGLRSTRILTRDDVEVIVPNAVIGNSKIVNESGGPYEMFRVRIDVSVAYGSDIDQVRALLMQVAAEDPMVQPEPEARVRFRSFGDSGLNFQLLIWVEKPELRGKAVDQLNTAVYKSFQKNGIEIPYPKRDVYLHSVAPKV